MSNEQHVYTCNLFFYCVTYVKEERSILQDSVIHKYIGFTQRIQCSESKSYRYSPIRLRYIGNIRKNYKVTMNLQGLQGRITRPKGRITRPIMKNYIYKEECLQGDNAVLGHGSAWSETFEST
jgi:hypothetical protein